MSSNQHAITPSQSPGPQPARAKDGARHGFFSLYKSGQGYWTRVLSAVGAATIILAGVAWLWGQMLRIQENTILWQSGMAATVIIIGGVFLWWLLNKPKVADFMIATEAEMKKVNWPSKREIFLATCVVIGGTIIIGILLFLIDIVFGWFFLRIGILEATANGDAL
jgi:preprotein translocase subunit SecE